MNKKQEKLIIFDGNAILHRSFHALPSTLTDGNGKMVNAVYGFASVLLKTIKDFKPGYAVVTFDKKSPTFRHKMYKEYKANREKAPDELYMQISEIKKIIKSFGVPIFEMAGFEADDLIGTICQTTENKKQEIENIVVTGDMDLLQLVNSRTKVYKFGRGLGDSVLFNDELVKLHYDILPDQVIDYKALRGDPSDNIPGVKGVGEKTAIQLLEKFKTLENLYQKLEENNWETDDIKPRVINLLKEGKNDAFLSKELATVKCDVKMDINLQKMKFGDFERDEVVNIFNKLEFKSLVSRLDEIGKGRGENTKTVDKFTRNEKEFKYVLVDDDKKFEKFFIELKKQKEFTFDTETTGLNPKTCELLGISFSWKEGEASYVRFVVDDLQSQDKEVNLFNYNDAHNVQRSTHNINPWLEKLRSVFEDKSVLKNAHNIKYDMRVLVNNGVNVRGESFDTMIASYVLNSGIRQHGLDATVLRELGFEKINKDDLLGVGKNKTSWAEVSEKNMSLYSCEDADFTNRLVKTLRKKLKREKLYKLFQEIEMPLVKTIIEMEENGIVVDDEFFKKMSQNLTQDLKSIEEKIYKSANCHFNIRSTKQLKEVLFEKLEIPTKGIKKTKTGYSTAFDELEKIKEEHDVIAFIQKHRELSKLLSTYIDATPKLVNEKTKRVHTSFNQTVASTGRLSSSDPNLQNIPVRTEHGREIRRGFVAKKGFKLVAIDYSQIELRVAAHLSNDKKMIEAFNRGDDIHASTAALINGVELNEVTKDMRRGAKAVNFGVLYGQGARGLAKSADITFQEANEFIEKYFESFSDVKKYLDGQIEKAKNEGFVETMFQRKRYLSEINSSTTMIKKAAERMAINTPIQGTAADIIKIAMIKVFEGIKRDDNVSMLLQVHDELVFEIYEKKIDQYAQKIKNIMESAVKLKVPLIVDVKVGKNWGKMEVI